MSKCLMDLGWCDVCLRVGSARDSHKFYESLGFRKVEGSDDEGWAVVTNGDLRLGLFEPSFMGAETVTLNFRGGDVPAIAQVLAGRGHAFESGPKSGAKGGWSATMRDPDGYGIFFDASAGETKKE